jgi:hypothetical protein
VWERGVQLRADHPICAMALQVSSLGNSKHREVRAAWMVRQNVPWRNGMVTGSAVDGVFRAPRSPERACPGHWHRPRIAKIARAFAICLARQCARNPVALVRRTYNRTPTSLCSTDASRNSYLVTRTFQLVGSAAPRPAAPASLPYRT